MAEQGDRALALLTGQQVEPGHQQPLRPALVLLDLNIPGIGGRELLTRIKCDPALASIPVVILSTSQHPTDIESCYGAHANSYHAKSDDLTEYQATARQIMEYWLSAVVNAAQIGESQTELSTGLAR